MKKQAVPMKVKQMKKMFADGRLTFDNPVQRMSGQWKNDQQSLLIHSILDDYIIPPIYLIKTDKGIKDSRNRPICDYDVLDGKQRLTTVFNYIDGEFELSDITPAVEVDGIEYDLAGKLFEQLDTELQENIENFLFTIYNLEGNSDEEVEEFFLRINGGVSLSKNQITKGKVGIQMMKYLNKILEGRFFSKVCSFSGAQAKAEVDLCALLQAALLFDVDAKRWELETFSEADVQKYGTFIHDGMNESTRKNLESAILYLESAFGENKVKFLKKTHIPIVVYVADFAAHHGISPDKFAEWFDNFVNVYYTPDCEYAQYCGAGSVKKPKVVGRIEVMKRLLSDHFNISEDAADEENVKSDVAENEESVDSDTFENEEAAEPDVAGNEENVVSDAESEAEDVAEDAVEDAAEDADNADDADQLPF